MGSWLARETSAIWTVNESTEVGIRLSQGWGRDGCFDEAAKASFKYLVAGKCGNLGSSLPDKELQSSKIALMMQNLSQRWLYWNVTFLLLTEEAIPRLMFSCLSQQVQKNNTCFSKVTYDFFFVSVTNNAALWQKSIQMILGLF